MRNIKSVLIGAAFALYVASPAYAIGPFPNQPLYLSSAVSPNVMLLMDDSGSMRHIIWEQGYDNDVNYFQGGSVDFWNGSRWQDLASESGTYITKSDMKQGGCATDFSSFRLNGVSTKCLRFPDPVGGGNTWFVQNYIAYLVGKYETGTDFTALEGFPKDFRMSVAKSVAKNVIANNSSMRFGLFSFIGKTGGELEAAVGSTQSTLNTKIDALTPNTSTPLAEAYYEVSRYFRGLSKGSGQTGTYTSPIQYRCQKNFGIVITDGLPTYDTTFPSNDPDDVADTSASLPNWDGLAPATASLTPSPKYSDGYQPQGVTEEDEGYTLYLDDIAKFSYDIDMMKSGNDLAGKSYNSLGFVKQNLQTFTVGFAESNQMLSDAAEYGHGSYYTANDADSLAAAMNSALQSIREQTSSASAITANSTRIQEDTLIYQARFNSADWTGEVRAFNVEENGDVGSLAWTTSTQGKIPNASSRNIFTYNGTSGRSLVWDNLTTDQRESLFKTTSAVTDTEENARLRLGWLRGENDGVALGTPYESIRLRSRNLPLGDIINSDPKFVGAQNNGYNVPNTDATGEPADSYFEYLTAKANRTPLVIVGANDGMVHAFNGSTGEEAFAYVPSTLFKKRTISPGATPGLIALMESDYDHQFYADGSFGLGDVYNGSAWKTYLAGGLGSGGRGVFALDVTDRASFGAEDVLWEHTAPDSNTTSGSEADWNDLGYVFGEPTIARTQNDTWVAIFGNGYASNRGKAALYIVNATTGALIKKIVVSDSDETLNNGLSAVTAFLDANRRITYIYGGDIQGNLWKFDLTASNANNWEGSLLFQAKKGTVRQPITGKVRVISHPAQGRLVVFGTGKYLETGDKTNTALQSLYGIWDRGRNNDGTVLVSTLVQQTISSETTSNGREFRIVSQNSVDWTTKFGWYLDLRVGTTNAGERVISMPLVNKDRMLVSTFTPLPDPCLSGGESWILGLNVLTGGRLDTTVFDVNGDGYFNTSDMLGCGGGNSCDASGFKLGDGTLDSPGAIFGDGFDSLYSSGLGDGGIEQNTAAGSGGKPGRMSWRQIQ
ncbi:pilus assembly protein [Pseudomonas sp. PIC25]|uniref:pilus assembly protein n=1 Tax=Pseudomonas sp. PIC25 TaxID=1958773 RepID=UPI000BAC0876|nr:PilC/PilY family type IV pilus protein [Pseudomonas sp. PIC25]